MTQCSEGYCNERIFSTPKQEYIILREYELVAEKEISGVYVIPSYQNSLLWFGVIFIDEGFYDGAVFRFHILLSNNFPNDHETPSVVFQNDVFHPLICPYSGIMNISVVFPMWNKDIHHIWQMLDYLKTVFINPSVNELLLSRNNIANQVAASLLFIKSPKFRCFAQECAEKSRQQIFDEPVIIDRHYIIFEKPQEDKKSLIKVERQLEMNILEQSSISNLIEKQNFYFKDELYPNFQVAHNSKPSVQVEDKANENSQIEPTTSHHVCDNSNLTDPNEILIKDDPNPNDIDNDNLKQQTNNDAEPNDQDGITLPNQSDSQSINQTNRNIKT